MHGAESHRATGVRRVLHYAWIPILASVLIAAYSVTLSPSPRLEDDGLFILASYFAGVAHSPGYPAYILLTQPFHLLPFSSFALKVHATNLTLGVVLCCWLGIWLNRTLKQDTITSFASAICLGFSTLFWHQAVIAEVYMLNALLFLITLMACFRLSTAASRDIPRQLFLCGVLYGVALSNHWPLTLAVSPIYLVLVLPNIRNIVRRLHFSVAGTTIGLAPYAWMYFRSHTASFAHMGPLTSADEFWYFVSRKVYAETDHDPLVSWHDKILYVSFFARQFFAQFALTAAPFVILGFITQWKRLPTRLCAALTLTMLLPVALTLLLDFTYSRLEIVSESVYPLPLYVVAAVWLAIGLGATTEYIGSVLHAHRAIVTGALGALLVVTTFGPHFRQLCQERDSWAVPHARYVLSTLPRDADLFVMDDWLMAIVSYLHFVDHVRPDVTLLSEYGTFLPDRLFPYFTPPDQKAAALVHFARTATGPVFTFQNPSRYGLAYRDMGYYYAVGDVQQATPPADTLPLFLLGNEPVGEWSNLYWRYLLNRLVDYSHDFAGNPDIRGNFVVDVLLAQRAMSGAGSRDAGKIGALLESAQDRAPGRDNLDVATLRLAQGDFLTGTGQALAANEMYRQAVERYPVPYNPAVQRLADSYAEHCRMDELSALLRRFDIDRPGQLKAVNTRCRR